MGFASRDAGRLHSLSDPEFVWRFERGAAVPADDGGAIAAGERIGDFAARIAGSTEREAGVRLRGLRLVWSP